MVASDTRMVDEGLVAKSRRPRGSAPSRNWESRQPDPKKGNLESICRYAADALLALDWGCAQTGVRAVVEDMVVNTHVSRNAMFWLLVQSAKLPQQTVAVCYLNELAAAIRRLRPERFSRRSLC